MNTLLFTLEYPPFHGGVANYYGQLVKNWPEPNNIFVLHNDDHALINEKLTFVKWLPALFALKKSIKKHKIDHIIVGHILPLGIIAWLCSKLYGIKYSVILHGLDFSLTARLPRKKIISKIILNQAALIICSNSYTAEQVKKIIINHTKICQANPGVEDFAAQKPELAAELIKKYNLSGKLILLSVGRLVKRKGFDKVIEAMPGILKKVSNIAYVIIGAGEELENFKTQIAERQLNDKIIIINNANDAERNAWYQVSDIFIMPSRSIKGDYEGFGIVYLEANLAGKPVIAGLSGGVGDAVVDGLNGLTVDSENKIEIRQAILKLAADPELRKKLGEQGRKRAIKEFNWQKQIVKIYMSLRGAAATKQSQEE